MSPQSDAQHTFAAVIAVCNEIGANAPLRCRSDAAVVEVTLEAGWAVQLQLPEHTARRQPPRLTHCTIDRFSCSLLLLRILARPPGSDSDPRRFCRPSERRAPSPLPVIVPTDATGEQRSAQLGDQHDARVEQGDTDDGAGRHAARRASSAAGAGSNAAQPAVEQLCRRHPTRASDGAQKEPQMRVVPSHRSRCLRPATVGWSGQKDAEATTPLLLRAEPPRPHPR